MGRSHTDKELNKYIGQKVKELRQKAYMTQWELAASAKLTQAGLSDIEKRRGIATIGIWHICQALKIEPSDLFPEQ